MHGACTPHGMACCNGIAMHGACTPHSQRHLDRQSQLHVTSSMSQFFMSRGCEPYYTLS